MRFPNSMLGPTASALGAACLFSATTPLASIIARSVSALWLSATLYLGVALLLLPLLTSKRWALAPADAPWLLACALIGGVAAPVLFVTGLRHTDAATASLLLAFEPVATALIAWLIVREHANRRTIAGTIVLAAGAAVLAWRGSPNASLGGAAVIGAAVCWGIDNNLTTRITSTNASAVAGFKGLVAGAISVTIALVVGDPFPPLPAFAAGIIVGLVGYGLSLILFIRALRGLGTARASAYFATAPFLGALLSLKLGRPPDPVRLALAGSLMSIGVWLHVGERHEHDHVHDRRDHEHAHTHDAHHTHAHRLDDPPGASHAHRHRHEQIVHRHAHAPDIDHRHTHGR